MRDVLALQSDMARAITERIKVRLTPGQARRLAETRQVDPEAYQSCLRGRYAWTQYTREGFDQSYRLFRHAIEIDPAYASAYAGLADAYYGSSSIFLAPNEAIPQARAAAEKALALDSTLAPAHTSLGIVKMVYDLDWPGAEREFRRSLELQPNDANAHLWLGHLLVCRGQFDAGLAELRRALERDPLSPWIRSNLGWHLYFARRYSESAEVLTAALRTDPNYYMHVFLGLTRGRQGDLVGGVTELEKAVAVNRNNDDEAQLGQVYALAGRRADAERIIAKFLERRRTEFVPAGNIAMIYAALGRREEAFHWLEMAFEDHSEWLIFLGVDPGLDPLRSDPRFAAFLRRAHLTS
jgi:tetratricopeptide (TPR) repeat protein